MPPKRGRPSKADLAERETATAAAATRSKRAAASTEDDDPQPKSKKARTTHAAPAEEVPKKTSPPKASTITPPSKTATATRNTKSAPASTDRGPGRPRKATKSAVPDTSGGHQQRTRDHRSKAAHAPEELPLGEQTNQAQANEQLQTEAVDAEQTPKRGRGRPKKVGSQLQTGAMEAEQTPKRGRGRPKKAGSQLLADMGVELEPKKRATAKKATTDVMTASNIGKKRGRPKSNNFTEDFAAELEDEIEPEQATKRTKTSNQQEILDQAHKKAGSGRPRKTPAATDDTDQGSRRKPVAAASAQEDDSKSPAKKGRGRPRKDATPATEPAAAKSIVDDIADVAENAIGKAEEESCIDEHGRQLWLMKAEPTSRIENGVDVKFSIDDLAACTEPEPWTGVRNPVATKNMKAMKLGDLAFFYHSNAGKLAGVAGIMEVVGEATPDLTAFDKNDPYYKNDSDKSNPKWYNVHVEFRQKMPRLVALSELKSTEGLKDMVVVRNSRLSVTKVTKNEWDIVTSLAGAERIPPRTNSAPTAVMTAPVTGASAMAAAVKGTTDAISQATSTAAAAMSAAVKNATEAMGKLTDGIDPPDTLPTAKRDESKRKSRASSAQPSKHLKTPAPTSDRASSTHPEQKKLASVDEDAIDGAVPPTFQLRSSPPLGDGVAGDVKGEGEVEAGAEIGDLEDKQDLA